ncbi:ABC-type Mn2+/Zn2+ transport systems, permease component [Paracholeplasma brassicae]|uniref:ABC-type Mn2+/Zn2+ transport systems, permease component n=1 Tax=Acholeplasma brassicae TaxID=61635 RepID=U4KRC2_9MOLU|nr:metal ABC transporter permease [Paracholeplasma brassicae]CCV65623.1 ABC-type Mn2+/Zn2+ transport systems, permease component [Paracholeplasma brassicae]
MFEIFTWPFMLRAILIGLLLASTTALLSNFLVVTNQALIGDGLAHISFTGIAIGLLFSNEPTIVAIPFAIIAAVIIKRLIRHNDVEGDTAIGLVASVSMAIGLIVISTSKGFNRSVESMLVGSIFSTTYSDVIFALVIFLVAFVFILLSYQKLFSITYDSTYAKFSKINVAFYDYAIAIITAVVIVLGVQTIGTLLISAFIIFPAVSSSLVSKSFKQLIIYSIIINIAVTLIGIISAHYLEIPAGSTIIIVHGILFSILFFIKSIKGRD